MEDYSVGALTGLAVGLLATGAISGVLAGLLGVGGGIVIVPVLVIVTEIFAVPREVAMPLVVGTSLATIIPTSISSARAHHKRGAIDFDILRGWGPWVFLGALLGGVASEFIGADGLTLVFGSVALLVSINLAIPHTLSLADAPPQGIAARAAVSTPIGFISALMGIGGGTLAVPVMTMLRTPIKTAVATASVFGLMISAPAMFGFIWAGLGEPGRPPYSLGYVHVPAAVLLFSVSVFTAPLGAHLAHSLRPERLRLAFAIFLGVSAVRMLWKALS
ncbi:MAG: sulfite exporter TauE/SafE family protein [Neomegalonema sp.]|nr:sulfite exporter TauE/SafE family protein [Neomegalonema sp.]